ncbi:hypothetical protein IWW47_000869 [Coemansia sp. RSA 2052]|nr:hypothetical protein IWW47_000869 [Coemansia sp. RSA 2052]
MRQMSSTIRVKPDWIETLKDAEMCADWAAEAKAKQLTDVEFCYLLDELEYYSSLHPTGSNVRLSAADGVWLSDTLIDTETTNRLKEYAAILESTPSRQKDWHPDDRSHVLNLIDPSLFPLIYSRSKLCRQPCASPQAALNPGVPGEFPGSRTKWYGALRGSDYYIPPLNPFYFQCASDKSSWLPSEFRMADDGAVTIESYINNLHPIKHAALYPAIASIFSKFLPLLEQVVTDLVHPHRPRVVLDLSKYYQSDKPKPEYDDRYYEEKYKEWKKRATFVYPQPEPFVAPARPASPYKLCGRRLQAIVRMSSVELSLESPSYSGEDWSLAGLGNERIIATGVFFYDVANVSQRNLQFHQERSVFPSILQHKMPELELVDRTNPGHCKMLTFYFVDPSTHIPSTEIVPPQQQEWHFEDVLASEPFRSLPQLVIDGIMDKIDFPFSLKEAKRLRSQEPQGTKVNKDIAFELFEPCVFI